MTGLRLMAYGLRLALVAIVVVGTTSACAPRSATTGADLDLLARGLQVAVHQLNKAGIDSSLEVKTSVTVPASGAFVIVGRAAAIDLERAGAAAPALLPKLQAQTSWPGEHFLGVVSHDRVQSLDLQGLGISRQLHLSLAPGRRDLTLTLRSQRGEIFVSAIR